jgi:hypothetical protein
MKHALQAIVVALGIICAQTAQAVPAAADSSDDPCPLALLFICRMVPIAPDLDHDVDLTKQISPSDPAAPPADSAPVGDVSVDGSN